MFDLDWRYNRPIVDQTCTFQCIIPKAIYQNTIGMIMHRLVGMGLYIRFEKSLHVFVRD